MTKSLNHDLRLHVTYQLFICHDYFYFFAFQINEEEQNLKDFEGNLFVQIVVVRNGFPVFSFYWPFFPKLINNS